jgi:hypothetical protein
MILTPLHGLTLRPRALFLIEVSRFGTEKSADTRAAVPAGPDEVASSGQKFNAPNPDFSQAAK